MHVKDTFKLNKLFFPIMLPIFKSNHEKIGIN